MSSQKNYKWSKQPINETIGSPTLADVKAINVEFPFKLKGISEN